MCMTVFYILWASIEQRYNAMNNLGTWIKPGPASGTSNIPNNSGGGSNTAQTHAITTVANGQATTSSNSATSGIVSGSTQIQPAVTSSGIHIELSTSHANSMNNLTKSIIAKPHMYEKNPNLKTVIINSTNANLVQNASRRPSYRFYFLYIE